MLNAIHISLKKVIFYLLFIVVHEINCQQNYLTVISNTHEWIYFFETSIIPRSYLYKFSVAVDRKGFLEQCDKEQGGQCNLLGLSQFNERNGKFYLGDDISREALIWDFTLKVDDTAYVQFNKIPVKCTKVDSVVLLDGVKRKRIEVACPEGVKDVWIEGIGSLFSGFSACSNSRILVCFKVNGKVVYSKDESTGCWISVGTNDLENVPERLFPNPAVDKVNLDQKYNHQKFIIYNQLGAITKQGKVEDGKLDVAELKNGYYIIAIETDQGSRFSRFIKSE
jgi:hypothetical protein